MELGNLYQVVLMLVLIGMIGGIGILVLDKFGGSPGVGSKASTSINATRDAVSTLFTDWLPIIVLVVAVSVILFLVIRSFSGGMGGGRK